MPTTDNTLLSIIIPTASGLLGALIGGLSTFLIQVQRLRHEWKLESEKESFAKAATADARRTEFRLKRWTVEAEALSTIKSHVKYALDRLRAPLDQDAISDLHSRLAEVSSLSSRVTRHTVLMSHLSAFDRDVKLFAAAARTNNMEIVGGPTFKDIHEFGNAILKESDRLILEQPDLSPVDRLKRAVSCITRDLGSRDVFRPEDEMVRSKIVDYFRVLRDDETVELTFGDDQLSALVDSFQGNAGKVFDQCDLAITGGVSKSEYGRASSEMRKDASAIMKMIRNS